MKKNTKGAIALGAAALLLAGGAGTYAAWSDEANIGGGTVTAGNLAITGGETGEWTWGNGVNTGKTFVPGTDRIVPGDVVQYTADYQVQLSGTNLVAALTSEIGGLDGGLKPYLVVETTSPDDIDNITPSANPETYTVTTVITFDPSKVVEGDEGMNESASLASSTITLEQVLPAGGGDGAGEG
ncbi:alternate-type signal peptide domain-containing protein [Dietzia sp. NPDC055343]